MEWINDGVTSPAEGSFVVAWRPVDGSDAQVVSTYGARPENNWRQFRVESFTYYRAGAWEHTERKLIGDAHRSRSVAWSWAKRDAEMEAANVHAVSWDGQVPA